MGTITNRGGTGFLGTDLGPGTLNVISFGSTDGGVDHAWDPTSLLLHHQFLLGTCIGTYSLESPASPVLGDETLFVYFNYPERSRKSGPSLDNQTWEPDLNQITYLELNGFDSGPGVKVLLRFELASRDPGSSL